MILTDIKIEGDIIAEILSNPEVQDELENEIKENFNALKESALEDFEEDKVTQEISDPSLGNISNTLGGYGDLFGFIGFTAGTDPIGPVREVLKEKIKLIGTNLTINYPRNKKGQFATGKQTKSILVKYQVPDLDDFDEAAKFDGWNGGRNWVKGIEKGISGISYYANYQRGRSERGIQLKGQVSESEYDRPSGFKTRKYITKIVNNFKNNFNKNIK